MDGTHLTYLDFELEIGQGEGREYPVAVVRSPAGEARETMRFPYDELALENRLLTLQNALLRSGGKYRLMPSPEEQAVQEFGGSLFEALLAGEARSRYDVSQQVAAEQGKGLRLKLRIQPPELAALPWEFLYDPRRAEYVCLSRSTPVVRYLELPQPIQPLTVAPPLRILGMIASPHGLPPLDVMREKQRVDVAVQGLQADGLAELTWLAGPMWRDLQKAMRGGPWHVFHFIGHGGFDRQADEGFIALADEEGDALRLSATQLGRLLADHGSLRLAVLNACEGARGGGRDIFSSTASILARRGIPAVVAMQYEITDRAAIELARAFYEALTEGMPVDAALAEARKAVSLAVANSVEWGTPVLYMRSRDGVLFTPQPQGATGKKRAGVLARAALILRKFESTHPGWALWLYWVLASIVGVVLGVAVPEDVVGAVVGAVDRAVPFAAMPLPLAVAAAVIYAVDGAVVGAVVGVMQWVVLRRQITRAGWWVLASTVGVAVGPVVALSLAVGGAVDGAVIYAVVGAVVGVMQWVVLRRQITRAGWWVLASTVGVGVAVAMSGVVDVAVSGGIYGTITGATMAWLLRQRRKAD